MPSADRVTVALLVPLSGVAALPEHLHDLGDLAVQLHDAADLAGPLHEAARPEAAAPVWPDAHLLPPRLFLLPCVQILLVAPLPRLATAVEQRAIQPLRILATRFARPAGPPPPVGGWRHSAIIARMRAALRQRKSLAHML